MAPPPPTEIYHDTHLTLILSPHPTTPGHAFATLHTHTQTQTPTLFSLPKPTFITILTTLRRISHTLRTHYTVQRCALITTGGAHLSLLPLHGLTPTWQPVTNPKKTFHDVHYPGYLTSQDAPLMPTAQLNEIAHTIRSHAPTPALKHDCTFHGPADDANIFARIVRGEAQQWRVWEDDHHVAFLTPFPNTVGFTVLVPRAHLASDILGLEEGAYARLMGAAYELAGVLKRAFGLERCGMVFEGFEIDYAHVKLIPVHGAGGDVGVGEVLREECREIYPGYVSSLPGPPVADYEGLVRRAGEVRREVLGG
ncbi:L-asparaginase [Aspergillus ellipticus CBS 707.79]|uniref:L-asparaginase n=1 Tax=Aspergillus ellipticus CBS 707.79 TaxID=1448320 RepID=A0A319E6P1_9EURO|nr:L-asparaginase [Aspergillus ellipticus CBS 707.79]